MSRPGGPGRLAGPAWDESPGGAFEATFPTNGRDVRENTDAASLVSVSPSGRVALAGGSVSGRTQKRK